MIIRGGTIISYQLIYQLAKLINILLNRPRLFNMKQLPNEGLVLILTQPIMYPTAKLIP
jgi:hypothetical protein